MIFLIIINFDFSNVCFYFWSYKCEFFNNILEATIVDLLRMFWKLQGWTSEEYLGYCNEKFLGIFREQQ